MEPKHRDRAKKVKASYEIVFSSEEGQEVLRDLVKVTGLMGPSLDFNSPDAMTMAFNDGAKSIVSRIIHTLNMQPEKFLELMKDTQNEQEDFYV